MQATVDPNIAAKQRYDADTDATKINLALGTLSDARGKPWKYATAFPRALRTLSEEVGGDCGSYATISPDLQKRAQENLLETLGLLPHMINFSTVLWAGRGGTGGLSLSVLLEKMQRTVSCLAVQEDSWPGYASIGLAHTVPLIKMPVEFSYSDVGKTPEDSFFVFQLVHNGTGYIRQRGDWMVIAELLSKRAGHVLFDVPYLGFEHPELDFSRAVSNSTAPLRTCVDRQVPMIVVVSPTKIYNTFFYRPGAPVVIIEKSEGAKRDLDAQMQSFQRGTGGFLDVATNALIRAYANDIRGLHNDHALILERLGEAVSGWTTHARGSCLARYFRVGYGGLFRILTVKPGALMRLQEKHVHVVDATVGERERIRINIAGLPFERAEEIVHLIAAEAI